MATRKQIRANRTVLYVKPPAVLTPIDSPRDSIAEY
jgi:hypothetical protein